MFIHSILPILTCFAATWQAPTPQELAPPVPTSEVAASVVPVLPDAPTITLTPVETGHRGGLLGWCGGVRHVIVNDAPPEPESGDFQFVVTYEPSVPAAWRPVIDFAVAEWDGLVRSRGFRTGSSSLTVRLVDLGLPGPLAVCTTFSFSNGTLNRAEIEFNTRYTFFADPTPTTNDDLAFAQFDLLSVARHELGHAVGWQGTGNPRVAALVTNNVLDPARLNIGLTTNDAAHTSASAHPGDVMNPSIASGMRRFIALYPTASGPARSFESLTAMQYVDPSFGGSNDGSAAAPWRSFDEAVAFGNASLPLLLAPRTIPVTRNATFSAPRTFTAARGGATVAP